jgi:hypothetical protein
MLGVRWQLKYSVQAQWKLLSDNGQANVIRYFLFKFKEEIKRTTEWQIF